MIRVEKMNVSIEENGKVKWLWAFIGLYNMTLLQVYSQEEPVDLLTLIQKNYDKNN